MLRDLAKFFSFFNKFRRQVSFYNYIYYSHIVVLDGRIKAF